MKLKAQYNNTKVIRNGLTFDSNINNEGEYKFFFDNGFADLFEVEEENHPEITKAEVKKPKAKKYKGINEDGKKEIN